MGNKKYAVGCRINNFNLEENQVVTILGELGYPCENRKEIIRGIFYNLQKGNIEMGLRFREINSSRIEDIILGGTNEEEIKSLSEDIKQKITFYYGPKPQASSVLKKD